MSVTPRERREDLERIERALEAAGRVLEDFTPGDVEVTLKRGGDPVTEADRRLDEVLFELLPADGEGWLSEETRDDRSRLECERVWVVDPLDGTREFIQGIPEWCVSIGLVERGRAVAGGILNPAAGELFVGSLETGVRLNGEPVAPRAGSTLAGARVLASRSEVGRGEWKRFLGQEFEVVPMGSVAYKLARVAAGLADATWTLVPKHEWDVAAGVALVGAAGGVAVEPGVGAPPFNRPRPLLRQLAAFPAELEAAVLGRLGWSAPGPAAG